MSEKTKVICAFPAHDSVSAWFAHDYARALTALALAPPFPLEITIGHASSSILPQTRQDLMDGAINTGADVLISCDADMRFPEWAFHRLLVAWKEEGCKVVGGNYVKRRQDWKPVTWKGGKVWGPPDNNALQKVSHIGFGLCLFDIETMKTLPKPHFDFTWMEAADTFRGEDVHFCALCADHDIPVYVDHGLPLGHLGEFEFTIDFARQIHEFDGWIEKSGTPLRERKSRWETGQKVQNPVQQKVSRGFAGLVGPEGHNIEGSAGARSDNGGDAAAHHERTATDRPRRQEAPSGVSEDVRDDGRPHDSEGSAG